MDEAHHPAAPGTRALVGATAANGVLLVGQVVGAVVFGSVALLADSVHQASDVVSLVLALVIAALVARPRTPRYTFGFRRADALGGLAHAVLLLGGAGWVLVETIDRFRNADAHDFDGLGVVVIAVLGLVVNGASARWLAHAHEPGRHDHEGGAPPGRRSLNIDGAVLHLLADALGSAAVLVGALVVLVTDDPVWDAVASAAVLALIVWSALRLARASLHVLLDGVPAGLDVTELATLLRDDPMVRDAHHLHVRSLDGDTLSLTGHVLVDTADLHEAQVVTDRLAHVLGARGIGHVTLQAECHPCDEPEC